MRVDERSRDTTPADPRAEADAALRRAREHARGVRTTQARLDARDFSARFENELAAHRIDTDRIRTERAEIRRLDQGNRDALRRTAATIDGDDPRGRTQPDAADLLADLRIRQAKIDRTASVVDWEEAGLRAPREQASTIERSVRIADDGAGGEYLDEMLAELRNIVDEL